jgi:hypothetical protein
MSTTRAFPGFEHLYSRVTGDQKAFVAQIDFGSLDAIAVLRGDAHPRSARAHWAMGKRVPDGIVGTTYGLPLLLSEALVTALRNAGCTGWSLYDVTLDGKHGENVGTYFGLMITGRCGPLKFGSRGRIMKRMPGGEVPRVVGVSFEEVSWDGSDIFMAPDRGFIFVTEPARDVILALSKSVAFERMTEIEIAEHLVPRG